MPILNSAHLWGRYKQTFEEHVEVLTLYHAGPLLGQHYNKDKIYRNVNWIYGVKSANTALKFGGLALYIIHVPK